MDEKVLSQEEIEALLNANNNAEMQEIGEVEKDIIGEVGNISMSTAATTLSSILGKKVNITTPRVSCITMKNLISECEIPKVAADIRFKEGLMGSNLLMVDVTDASIIADLMMGGDGTGGSGQLTELEMSAVAEAMNQMIGSASTAMATMLGKPIDILPPSVSLWDANEDINYEGMEKEGTICKISFNMEVEGLIKSEIMQIFSLDMVNEIAEIMMGDTNVSQDPVYEEPTTEPEPIYESQEVYTTDTQVKSVPIQENVTVSKPVFSQLTPKNDVSSPRNLDLIMDVPLEFSVVLGRAKKTIKEVLALGNGSVVELTKLADEPLEIYVNGKLIAHGEVVVINESFGIRITNILSKEQRVKNLN